NGRGARTGRVRRRMAWRARVPGGYGGPRPVAPGNRSPQTARSLASASRARTDNGSPGRAGASGASDGGCGHTIAHRGGAHAPPPRPRRAPRFDLQGRLDVRRDGWGLERPGGDGEVSRPRAPSHAADFLPTAGALMPPPPLDRLEAYVHAEADVTGRLLME